MRGMALGLDVRMIDKKIYVANLMPDSIAAMSLLIGECIVDVDGELVTSIPQMTSSMVKAMDKNGQVRLLVESPGNDMLRNMLRQKIAAAVGPSELKDLPLPPETKPWCEKGIAALKEKDPKPVYREPKPAKKKGSTIMTVKKRSTHFNEKTVEHDYYEDLQTSLIVKVPPPRTSTDFNPAL
ncbi:PDZ domain-containing protein [Trichostrongylus colubriformis]|uniref:PDZ domain-containing protein n=1 Tax=Trichostrongylus colubriformis TaxID=6319 RepID=A0AAN8FBM7_TRICO